MGFIPDGAVTLVEVLEENANRAGDLSSAGIPSLTGPLLPQAHVCPVGNRLFMIEGVAGI
ncbi:hypothetical protein ACWEPL_09175 [Nonomuraea sp. NPDC004186]